MRKVYVDIKAQVIIEMDDGIEVGEVISNMQEPTFDCDGATVVDFEIRDYEVTNSK